MQNQATVLSISDLFSKFNNFCIHETNCILLEGEWEALCFGGKVDLLSHKQVSKKPVKQSVSKMEGT